MQESAEDHDTEAALDGDGIGDEEAVRVEETAPSRPEEDQREAKKSAQEEGEKEAAPAPVK